MSMTYDEALEENPVVSRAFAQRECLRHSADFEEFVRDVGDHQQYQARTLLIWLGY
ncbi:hypothetical protein LZ023_40735 (plasmid) [Pseudomonas silvicola]|nr:hypothetical protein LZ023_41010 [Pseudomonas silvicola]WAH62262.1 hypothetical protein LZ023_40735 [Pseudomonas silvicola]